MEIEEFDQLFSGVTIAGSGQRSARCPAHDDRHASLSYNQGEHGGIVLTCHAGCDPGAILGSVGRSVADIMGKPYLVEEYPYTTAEGEVLWYVERWGNPKAFKQRKAPGMTWAGEAPPIPARVLYNMPGIAHAREKGLPVYLVEGEKDVHTLYNLTGAVATTAMGGAGAAKWLPQYTDMLAGLEVIIVADDDLPGRAHARDVAKALSGKAAHVSLTVSPYGNDVSDLLNAGYGLDALQPLPDFEQGGIYTAANIKTRKVRWAWPGYIPFGKLSILEGDPGGGKSALVCDLTARWTTGMPMPNGAEFGGKPIVVILISAEDDVEDTIVPRLEVAGANLLHVRLIPHGADPNKPFDLVADMPWLESVIVAEGAGVVVFDPITAFMSEQTDTHNDASTRRALYPLKRVASTTKAAIICVRHLNKGGGKALYRGGGSIGFVGASRTTHLIAKDPDDPKRRLLICQKNNLAKEGDTLSYEIALHNELPYLVWGDAPVDITAQEALDGTRRKEIDRGSVPNPVRAVERMFLYELLSEKGPMKWKEILAEAEDETLVENIGRLSEISLRRAREDMKLVVIGKPGSPKARWALPAGARPEVTESDESEDLAHLAHPLESQMDSQKGEQGEQSSPSGHGESPSPNGHQPLSTGQAETLVRVCQICQTTEKVTHWDPPGAYRCVNHNPLRLGR